MVNDDGFVTKARLSAVVEALEKEVSYAEFASGARDKNSVNWAMRGLVYQAISDVLQNLLSGEPVDLPRRF